MAREDPEYLAQVRRLPCAAREIGPCEGVVQAHHVRMRTGLGLKSHDWLAVPLCAHHHDAHHSGPLASLGASWWRSAVEATLRAVREGAVMPEWW